MSSSVQLQACVEKLGSSDPDVRLDTLNHIIRDAAKSAFISQDPPAETQLVNQVVALLSDHNEDIKGRASECIRRLAVVVRPSQIEHIATELVGLLGGNEYAAIALKGLVSELSQDSTIAPRVTRKIAPVLLERVCEITSPTGTMNELLAILNILVSRFNSHIPPGALEKLSPLLCHPHGGIRKKAIKIIARLVSHLADPQIQVFITAKVIPSLTSAAASGEEKNTALRLILALARYVGPSLKMVISSVITLVEEGDELSKRLGLKVLDQLVIDCPGEVIPCASELIKLGVKYANCESAILADKPEDGVMCDLEGQGKLGFEEDDDHDEDEDSGSDTENMPRFIRQSAIGLLASIGRATPMILETLFTEVATVLVSRSGDKDLDVRCEAWSALTTLIRRTRQVLSDRSNFTYENRWRAKPLPKIGEIIACINALVPKLLETLLGILSPEVTPPLPALVLLDTLLSPLPEGSPVEYVFTSGEISRISDSVEALLEEVLLFLAQPATLLTFSYMLSAFPGCSREDTLVKLTTVMLNSEAEIASNAINIMLEIIPDYTEFPPDAHKALQNTIHALLENPDTSPPVRELACKIVSTLLVQDISCDERSWELLRKRGRPQIVRQTIWDLDERLHGAYDLCDTWLGAHVAWCVQLICSEEEEKRVDKAEAMDCLLTLFHKHGLDFLNEDLQDELAVALPDHLDSADPALAQTLDILGQVFPLRPGKWSKYIENSMLPRLFSLASQPLPESSLDILVDLIHDLSAQNGMKSEDENNEEDEDEESDDEENDIASILKNGLKSTFDKVGASINAAHGTSRCLAAVVRGQPRIAPEVVTEYSEYMRPSSRSPEGLLVLSLLTLGEITQYVGLESQQKLFDDIIDFFDSDSESIQKAAIRSIGYICIGSPKRAVSAVLDRAKNDQANQPLLMHALEEFVLYRAAWELKKQDGEAIWSTCWSLAITSKGALDSCSSCLNKLFLKNPSSLGPRIAARLRDPDPTIRLLAILIIQHSFKAGPRGEEGDSDSSEYKHVFGTYDQYTQDQTKKELGSFLVALISILEDKDMNIRAAALRAINQSLHTNSQNLKSDISPLLPHLYNMVKPIATPTSEETEIKHKAYESLKILISTPQLAAHLDPDELLTKILHGLSDDSEEIKIICHIIFQKITQTFPTSVVARKRKIMTLLNATVTNRGAKLVEYELQTIKMLEQAEEAQPCGTLMTGEGNGMDLS